VLHTQEVTGSSPVAPTINKTKDLHENHRPEKRIVNRASIGQIRYFFDRFDLPPPFLGALPTKRGNGSISRFVVRGAFESAASCPLRYSD
jgi:hypothetical protein